MGAPAEPVAGAEPVVRVEPAVMVPTVVPGVEVFRLPPWEKRLWLELTAPPAVIRAPQQTGLRASVESPAQAVYLAAPAIMVISVGNVMFLCPHSTPPYLFEGAVESRATVEQVLAGAAAATAATVVQAATAAWLGAVLVAPSS